MQDKIFEAIKNDPANKKYTQAGIDPLYVAPKEAKILIVGQAPENERRIHGCFGMILVVIIYGLGWEFPGKNSISQKILRSCRWIFIFQARVKVVIYRHEKILLKNGIHCC